MYYILSQSQYNGDPFQANERKGKEEIHWLKRNRSIPPNIVQSLFSSNNWILTMYQVLYCEFRDKQGICHALGFLIILWEIIKRKKDHCQGMDSEYSICSPFDFRTEWSHTIRNPSDHIFIDLWISNEFGSQRSLGLFLMQYPNALNITLSDHNHCVKIFSFG